MGAFELVPLLHALVRRSLNGSSSAGITTWIQVSSSNDIDMK